MPSRPRVLVTALVACCLLAPPAGSAPRGTGPTAPTTRPNVLLIVADDQATSLFNRDLMPKVFRRLVDGGTRFDRHYVASGLCCPSRAEILTGLTQEHTRVDTNKVELDLPTIVEAVDQRGYRTAMVGKYLNSWPCATPRRGFDLWMCQGNGKSGYSLVDPTLNVDGQWRKFEGIAPQVQAERLSRFIRSTPDDQPFFAMYTPTSPHLPADDPRYQSMHVRPHRPPSYDEDTGAGNKPAYLHTPAFTPDKVALLDQLRVRMARAVRGLDDSVATVLDSLGDRAKNTVVVYVSDNGYQYGEHRSMSKAYPYEESVRTPFVIRAPQVTKGGRASGALVQNVDIAPTIADFLGIPWGGDGRSLVPVLKDPRQEVRDVALIEHCQGPNYPCGVPRLAYWFGFFKPPSWKGVVGPRWKYVRYATGERELYDLRNDPYELRNRAGDADVAHVQRRLADKLAALTGRARPATTIVTGPKGAQDGRTVRFTYLSRAEKQKFRCRLTRNGDPRPWNPCPADGWEVGPLKDGKYRAAVAAVGDGGRVDPTPAERAFTITTSGPTVRIKDGPPEVTKRRTATFRLDAESSRATFECRLRGGGSKRSWKACSTRVTYERLHDAEYTFLARAVGRGGNRTDPPAARAFAVDNAGPRAEFRAQPRSRTAEPRATFRFGFDEPTKGRVECRVDDRPWTRCDDGRFSADHLAPGPHTFDVRARDRLENSGMTTVRWVVDTRRPVVTVRAPVGVVVGTPQAEYSANEPTRRFECVLDFGVRFDCDPVLMRMFGLSAGPHVLQVWAVDVAGNISTPATTSWVQATGPLFPTALGSIASASDRLVTTITSPAVRTTSSEAALFTFAADRSVGVRFDCAVDGSGFAPCTTPVLYDDLPVGHHTVSVRAADVQGRTGPVTTTRWTVRP